MLLLLLSLLLSSSLSLSLLRSKKSTLLSLFDVRDKELETYISINSKSWDTERLTLYTMEIESPQQEPAKKGISFSGKFEGIKKQMVTEHMRLGGGEHDVFIFPYRKMQKISCDAKWRNKFQFYAGETLYQFWVDLWQGDCNTLANYFDINRANRQTKLSEAVKGLSSYGSSYIDANGKYDELKKDGVSIGGLVLGQEKDIKKTQESIAALREEAKTKIGEIARKEKENAELAKKNEDLLALMEGNKKMEEALNKAILKLREDSKNNANLKDKYEQDGSQAFGKLVELVELLSKEAVNADLGVLVSSLQKNRKLESFETGIRSILPA